MGFHHTVSRSAKMIAASAAVFVAAITSAKAQESQSQREIMTAGGVLTRFDIRQRAAYLAGIVEGLAYARFVQDNRATAGRDCIYNWFYRDERTLRSIHAAFERYPEALPGRLVGALANNACGGE